MDDAREEIKQAIGRVQGPEGVLILTDMFGGTPANLGLTFLEADRVEVITGVNLPMLIKLAGAQSPTELVVKCPPLICGTRAQRHLGPCQDRAEVRDEDRNLVPEFARVDELRREQAKPKPRPATGAMGDHNGAKL